MTNIVGELCDVFPTMQPEPDTQNAVEQIISDIADLLFKHMPQGLSFLAAQLYG